MLRATARTYLIVGGVLVLIGAAVGLIPFSEDGASCGPAFITTADPFEADLQTTWFDAEDIAAAAEAGSHQETCARRKGELRLAAITLVGVGTAALVTPRLGPLLRSARGLAVER